MSSLLIKSIVATGIMAIMPLVGFGQTENPRGIYKMITLDGKSGEIPAPYDQYKICTDSITLQVEVNVNGSFVISNVDKCVLNYTGDIPENDEDKKTRIYNSNSQHFIEKWWSTNSNHPFFPENGWCLEYYESGKFSDIAKPIFEALTQQAQNDKGNPFIGTWYSIGIANDLKTAKMLQKNMTSQQPDRRYTIFTPTHILMFAPISTPTETAILGASSYVSFPGKKSFTSGNSQTIKNVTWISKDCMIMEGHNGSQTIYDVLVRTEDNEPLIKTLAGIVIRK